MKTILVTGATGNQGGSVAKLLLQYQDQYEVRCLTRDVASKNAKALADKGALLVQGDLTDPTTLSEAVKGCWGVFAVTNFYDAAIVNDPMSEEQQGRNIAKAARDAGVQCFIWSTMPSSREVSGGRLTTRVYEGKHNVDAYIRELGLQGVFFYTGNFYENMVLRGHVSYNKDTDVITFKQPIIKEDTKLTMLYVEKDLSAMAHAVFSQWENARDSLDGKYLQACNARVSPTDIASAIEKASGKRCDYVVIPTTGVPERDTMFQLYNDVGMYPGVEIPDSKVLKLGVKFHNVHDYIRDRLLPHLGLGAVD